MTYGFKFNNAQGVPILEINDSTPRLVSVQAVTVPSSGTVTVSVPTVATTTNSVVALDNGAAAEVTSTGIVTIIGNSFVDGQTNLRLFVCDL